MRWRVAIVLAAGLLLSCVTSPPPVLGSAPDLATCTARGGEISDGMRADGGPSPFCLTPDPPAGRPCSDGAQCGGGDCIAQPDGAGRYELGPSRTVRGECAYYEGPPNVCAPVVRSGRLAWSCPR